MSRRGNTAVNTGDYRPRGVTSRRVAHTLSLTIHAS